MRTLMLVLQLACGTERHAVKVGADAGWMRVTQRPVPTTVTWLREQPRPAVGVQRAWPVELQVWTVRGVLLGWKRESDQDEHLVVADTGMPQATMIVEAVAPECTPRLSLRTPFAAVRLALQRRLGAAPATFRRFRPPIPVTLVGVGFWDFCHGQVGRAPNCVELHPLLAVRF